MNEKPEALRWAAILEHQAKYDGATDYKHKAAAELRRLHEVNVYLMDVYQSLVKDREEVFDDLAKAEAEIERLQDAVAAEREACARVCEAYKFTPAAEAIRARGKS